MARCISLLPYHDVVVCRVCLGRNCSLKGKVDFKRDQGVIACTGSDWKKLG